MPLTQQFESYRRKIREFLDDPGLPILYLTATAEMQPLAAKLFAGAEAEPTSDELVFAYAAPFIDAHSYYEGAAQSILDNIAEHRVALAKQKVEFGAVAPLDADLAAGGLTGELLFAEFVERLARALWKGVCRRAVVLLAADEPSNAAAFIASTCALGSALALGRTKCVVLTSPVALPAEIPAPQRLHVRRVDKVDRSAVAALHTLLTSPLRRVLLATTDGPSDADLLEGIRAARQADPQPTHRIWLKLKASLVRNLGREAVRELWDHAQSRSVKVRAPDMHLPGVDRFADLCERFAHAVLPKGGVLVVVLQLSAPETELLQGGRAFVQALEQGACSPRVKYIVVERTREGLFPPLEEAPRRITELSVAIDSEGIEAGLNSKLADPTLPVPERIQWLVALGVLATTRKDHERALSLHEEALALTEKSEDPRDAVMVWLGVGNACYGMQVWPSAQGAFTKALELALDAQFDVGIVNATTGLGNALLCADKHAQAEECYRSSVEWYDKLGTPLFACHVLTWLGECQRRSGDLSAAEQTWSNALERYRALGPDFRDPVAEGQSQVLARLIRLHEQRHDSMSAARCRHELEALDHPPPVVPEQP